MTPCRRREQPPYGDRRKFRVLQRRDSESNIPEKCAGAEVTNRAATEAVVGPPSHLPLQIGVGLRRGQPPLVIEPPHRRIREQRDEFVAIMLPETAQLESSSRCVGQRCRNRRMQGRHIRQNAPRGSRAGGGRYRWARLGTTSSVLSDHPEWAQQMRRNAAMAREDATVLRDEARIARQTVRIQIEVTHILLRQLATNCHRARDLRYDRSS